MDSKQSGFQQSKTWAIETFLRFLPNLKSSSEAIEYVHQNIEINETHKSRSVINIRLPEGTNTSFVTDNGFIKFEFDRVFHGDSSQTEVFDIVARDKVIDVLEGINSTIFAYGQTGTGKTYTMCGGDSFQDRGLIPRTIGLLFEEIRLRQQKASIFKCQVSFTEVYKEAVYDLLDPQKKNQQVELWTPVQLVETDSSLVLRNVNVFEVENEEDALRLFFMGSSNRVTSSTAINKSSSRSHAIFSLIVESQGIKNDKTVFTYGKINLVDLAGSERVYKMGNSNSIVKEAKAINLSLHFLEKVIISLRDQALLQLQSTRLGRHSSHIPYRNNVLTNMLRDGLGGNCRSAFVFTVASDLQHFEETLATCRFAQRCGEVCTQVHANAEIGLSDQLKELNVRIKVLERQIQSLEQSRAQAVADLESERETARYSTAPRDLTQDEKTSCRQIVQGLLSAAKEASAVTMARVIALEATEPTNADRSAAALVIDKSHEELYATIEGMDKAVLIELTSALGGLVQSMYLDKERSRLEQQAQRDRDLHQKAEELAVRMAAEQAERDRRERDAQAGVVDLGSHKITIPGLPVLNEDDLLMMMSGAIFLKVGFLGRKTSAFFAVTQDGLTLVSRHSPGGHESSCTPLSSFDSVDCDHHERKYIATEAVPLIFLKGKSGQKSLSLEYASDPSLEQNRASALRWADALSVAVQRAQAIARAVAGLAASKTTQHMSNTATTS